MPLSTSGISCNRIPIAKPATQFDPIVCGMKPAAISAESLGTPASLPM